MQQLTAFQIWYWVVNIFLLLISVFFSSRTAIMAVRIGRRLNQEQQKDNAKRNLFLLLFALRGDLLHPDFVRGLNQVDIVFEDSPTVLDAWHKLYDSLQLKEQANAIKNWERQRVDLLSSMAVSLGYSRIKQTDIIRDYYPEAHDNQLKDDREFRQDLVLYLRSGIEMQMMIIEQMKANQQPPNEVQTPEK